VLDCCIAYNALGGYCIPLDAYKSVPAQAIFAGDLWEPETIAFVRKHCAAGDVVHAGVVLWRCPARHRQRAGARCQSRSARAKLGTEAWLNDDGAPDRLLGQRSVVPVQTTTIDAAVPADRNVSIIHLDVEDHKPHAIAGAINTIKRCRPILIVELWYTDESDAQFVDTLSPLGYRATARLGRSAVLAPA
jgi:hypothetical protein